jgi:hypothetical protein
MFIPTVQNVAGLCYVFFILLVGVVILFCIVYTGFEYYVKKLYEKIIKKFSKNLQLVNINGSMKENFIGIVNYVMTTKY